MFDGRLVPLRVEVQRHRAGRAVRRELDVRDAGVRRSSRSPQESSQSGRVMEIVWNPPRYRKTKRLTVLVFWKPYSC